MVVAQTETANHECETKARQGCRSRARPGQDYRTANTTCMTPLKLDLNMLRERHLFPQDCPQFGVERGGVEGAGIVATMAFVGIPLRQFLDVPAAQARLTAVGGLGRHRPRRAGLIERIWPQVADRPGRLNSRPRNGPSSDFEEA